MVAWKHPQREGGGRLFAPPLQDLNRDHWSETVVNAKLKEIMVRAFEETFTVAKRENCNMRTAAYLVAVQRVADAMEMRGIYP